MQPTQFTAMFRPIYYLALLFLVGQPVLVQTQRSIAPSRQLHIQPLQLLFREAVVAYEWPVAKQISLRAGVGYRFNNPSAPPNVPIGTTLDYSLNTMVNPHLQAIKFSFGPVFYLNESRNLFVQSEYFFRHWWVNDRHMKADNGRNPDYSFDAIRTERTNVYGLKVLLGATGLLTTLPDETVLTYSAFAGIGVRYKTFWYESRNGTIGGQPVDYVFERGQGWLPTLHAGLLFTIGFAD